MTSKERIQAALNHEQSDKVPVDLGSTTVTGMHASTMTKFRKALGLEDRLVKVEEPFQILGMVEQDLRDALQVDVVGISPINTFFGFKNDGWVDWMLQDGTKVLASKNMLLKEDANGDLLMFPQSNPNVPPSARLPKGGYYFDTIVRQEEIDEDNTNGRADFINDYALMTDEELDHIKKTVDDYYRNTEYAMVGIFGGGGFGDASIIPGPGMIETPGVRKLEDWLMWHLLSPEYIKDVFAYQTEICIKNLELYYQAAGNKLDIIYISGTDYGTQKGEFISPDLFREFYKGNIKLINDWVHKNTPWKTFFHSCGSIVNLLDDFADAGVDILNPVQISANGMDARMLKEKYGSKFTFWGAAIDTQRVLPFGTPEEVAAQTRERLELFSKGGGFVCASIHNVQPNTPVENLLAFYNTIHEFNRSSEK